MNKYSKKVLIFIGFTLFWFLILGASGALTSGFHLIDDSEIIVIHNKLIASTSFNDVLTAFLGHVKIHYERFIPFYYLHRFLETALFGLNHYAWSVYNGFLAVLSSFLFYLFARKINFSRVTSIIFVFSFLTGFQSVIWSELGRTENIGITMFAFALYFMALSIKNNSKLNNIFFVMFLVLMTLSKESFILLIPAILFWKVLLEKEQKQISLNESLANNIVLSTIIAIIAIIELLYIKFGLGANAWYAGVELMPMVKYIETFKVVSLLKLSIVSLSVFLLALTVDLAWKKSFKEYIYIFLLFLLIVVPQVILYAKSGFTDRYLVPALLGYSVLLVYGMRYLKNFRFKGVLTLIIFIVTVSTAFNSYNVAKTYAIKGNSVKNILSAVKNNTSSSSNILLVSNPIMDFEPTYSMKIYINELLQNTNVYLLPIISTQFANQEFNNHLLEVFSKDQKKFFIHNLEDKQNIGLLLLFKTSEKPFLSLNLEWFKPKSYSRQDLGFMVAYIKLK